MKNFYFTLILFLVYSGSGFSQNSNNELNKEIQFSKHRFLPFYGLKKSGNTTIFQGNNKKKNYFEGWYFKMVGQDGESIISVIPGIALSSLKKNSMLLSRSSIVRLPKPAITAFQLKTSLSPDQHLPFA